MTKNKVDIREQHTLNDLTSVSKTILPLIKQIMGNKGLIEIELLKNWEEIIGPTLSKYSLPKQIKFVKNEKTNGTIEIMVLSGAFAMEIKQREQQIIEKINNFIGYSALIKIQIIQNSCPEDFLIGKNSIDNIKKYLVTPSEQNYITELVNGVKDNNLKERLEKLGQAIFDNNKKGE